MSKLYRLRKYTHRNNHIFLDVLDCHSYDKVSRVYKLAMRQTISIFSDMRHRVFKFRDTTSLLPDPNNLWKLSECVEQKTEWHSAYNRYLKEHKEIWNV